MVEDLRASHLFECCINKHGGLFTQLGCGGDEEMERSVPANAETVDEHLLVPLTEDLLAEQALALVRVRVKG